MQNALEYLNKLIDSGVEYPDAEYKASVKFRVNADELRAEYDSQFTR